MSKLTIKQEIDQDSSPLIDPLSFSNNQIPEDLLASQQTFKVQSSNFQQRQFNLDQDMRDQPSIKEQSSFNNFEKSEHINLMENLKITDKDSAQKPDIIIISEPDQDVVLIEGVPKASDANLKAINLPGSKMNNFNVTSSMVERTDKVNNNSEMIHELSIKDRKELSDLKTIIPKAKTGQNPAKASKRTEKSKTTSKFLKKSVNTSVHNSVGKISPIGKQQSSQRDMSLSV